MFFKSMISIFLLLVLNFNFTLSSPTQESSALERRSQSKSNCYGAPVQPWKKHHKPGWCKGKPHKKTPKWDGGDKKYCKYSWAKNWSCCKAKKHHKPKPKPKPHPNTPSPPSPVCTDGFEKTYQNYTTVALTGYYQGKRVGAATIDIGSYLTYGLVDKVKDCLEICDSIKDCQFVNIYREYNSTIKSELGGDGKLTCAAFSKCLGTSFNINYGGQDDPTYVEVSRGFCKSDKCQD